MAGEGCGGVRSQRGGIGGRPGSEHHGGADLLAQVGVGSATTATSTTSGWLATARSTVAAAMFSPPRMMTSLLRPVT